MLCLSDFEKYASERMDKAVYSFYSTGSERELTLRENEAAFQRYCIIPRILRDVESRDLSVTVLGEKLDIPIGLAPSAYQKLAHPEGEIAAARAAASMGTVYTMSTLATSSVEELAEKVPGCLRWMQLYVTRDRELTVRLIERAERAGFRALVLTVDAPFDGLRLKQRRNSILWPPHLSLPNIEASSKKSANFQNRLLTWDDVDWLRSVSKLPIILKGILSGKDAKLAVAHGASAIWVSNHGGRQLDGTIATIDALQGVVDAIRGSSCEVYMDGGIRWGSDIFKALLLGARAVFIGRPVLWGLAYSGEKGVKQIMNILKEELNLSMTLAGCRNYDELKTTEIIKREPSKL